ncbi:putative dimethylallyl tryptophan synthase [Penicillium brasilianum]|uniref:Putative dimethylallyl tryptophan synthase n=1 Tax=Penicillium brasilianum TaxID=104259 RepID=A0A1S9RN59_PENBI|nr:putative dimethylallyl tryptophan synthase [Penicillium brasilianum]
MGSTVSDTDDFESQLRVFHNVSRYLPTDDANQVFWWQTTGRHFARMMHEGRYPEARQVELLLFYRFVIAPRLGPRPTSATPGFRSRVAPGVGDGSPIGYSWRWGTGPNTKPLIRHYIEAIGPLTGTTADPLNEFAAKEMLHHLGQLVPGVELPLAWKFGAHIRPSLTDESTRAVAGSSILIGLQCAPDSPDVEVMAGLMTRSPAQVPELLPTIFPRAMRDAYGPDASLDVLNMVREFVEQDKQGKYLTILGTTAIDCCDVATSRFKVYVTTTNTSFDHLAAVMTLGGRKPEFADSLAQLKELWYALKGLDPEFPTTAEAPSNAHSVVSNGTTNGKPNANVSGVTFYFDIHPKYKYPHVKLQVDVSKHATSDLDAIHAVTGFLERRGQGADAQAYLNVVRAMVSDEELRTRRGLQAFFAFAFKGGEVDITSYFLPQVYRRYAEIQEELAPKEEGNSEGGMSPRSQRRSRFESY